MKRRALLAALAAIVAALCLPRAAGAEGASALTAEEKSLLARGEVIHRNVDFDSPEGPYFGGIAYGVIDAPPAEVMRVLLDVGAYRKILPLTAEAREVGKKGDNKLVFFRHGGRVASASYTAIVRRESPSVIRFWLDPDLPHEVEDCWGYFRVQPYDEGRTLLTYGAVLRLEAGLVRLLFSEKIRSFALRTPLLVQRYFKSPSPLPGR